MIPIGFFIIAFIFMVIFFITIANNSTEGGPIFGMSILFFIIGIITMATGFDEFKKKEFNYSPVPIVKENGNKYVFDGKNIMPPIEIPDGVQIVFKKHKESTIWLWPQSEKTYVLNNGD